MGSNVDELIEGYDVLRDLTKRQRILDKMKAFRPRDRADSFRKLVHQYSITLANLFDSGAAHDAYEYVEDGVVICFTLYEPKLNLEDSFALVKHEGRAIVENARISKIDATCRLTLEAVEHIVQASDYKDVGRRLLECRRYPTRHRALTWKTVVPATVAFENGLFHMYRKFGMY